MLRRTVTDELKKWKNKDKRKCLMIRGARQIGKTYAVDHFGKTEYESYIPINFLKTPSHKNIFAGDLDTKSLLMNISLYIPDAKLIKGRTLPTQ